MRRGEHQRVPEQRGFRIGGLGRVHVEPGAAEPAGSSAESSAASSTSPPLATLTNSAPGFIAPNAAVPNIPALLPVNIAQQMTASATASSAGISSGPATCSTSAGPPRPGRARTPTSRVPNGASRPATATPMAPRPTISTVAPCSDSPVGLPSQRPSASAARASASRLVSASRCSTAISATLSALPPASPGTRRDEDAEFGGPGDVDLIQAHPELMH